MRRLAAVVILALVATACTGDEVATRAPVEGASRGGRLVVAIDRPRSIDPQATDAKDAGGALVVETMCDRLVELDPVTGEPRPAIAESWIVADGGRRVTFKLRKGVRFHNGQELNAEDVRFTLSRLAERDFASPVASLMEPVNGYDIIHGNEEADDDRYRTQLRGVRVIESFSFEVVLDEDLSGFFHTLAHVAASPVPKSVVEENPQAFGQQPVCAGPYQMTEPWSPGDDITLERFGDYYGANTAFTSGGTGYADTIVFRGFGNRADQEAAFADGDVDAAIARAERDVAERAGDDAIAATTPTVEYVGLPVKVEPFNQRAVRVALSQAINRQRVIDEVYGGLREPAAEIVPPGAGPLHRRAACADRAPVTGNVEAARATLRDAGVDLSGRSLPLLFNDEFDHRELARAVADQWRDAFGLEVELVPMDWERYVQTGIGQPGFEGAFRMTWSPQVPGADAYLEPLFGSASIGRDNFTRFSDPAFDRTLEREARRAIDPQDVTDSYQALENIVCGEMPLIPLSRGVRLYLVDTAGVGSALGEPYTALPTGSLLVRELFVR